jgi:hypothetical protein
MGNAIHPVIERPDTRAWESSDDRYWNHGTNTMIGNIYSPTPVEVIDPLNPSQQTNSTSVAGHQNSTEGDVPLDSRHNYRSRSLRSLRNLLMPLNWNRFSLSSNTGVTSINQTTTRVGRNTENMNIGGEVEGQQPQGMNSNITSATTVQEGDRNRETHTAEGNIERGPTTSQSNEIGNNGTVIQRRVPTQMCLSSTPASGISAPIQWRHSDSHYGFRTAPINYGNTAISHLHFHPHIHHPHHLLPHSTGSNQIHSMSTMGATNTDTNYASVNGPDGYRLRCSEARDSCSNNTSSSNYFSTICSTNLPSYLWGPPPPYSQPNCLEHVNADDCDSNELIATQQDTMATNDTSTNDTTANGVSPSITSNEMIVSSDGSPARNNLDQQPSLMRTTKSGILLSPNENHRGASLNAFSSIKDTAIISCRASSNNGMKSTIDNEPGKDIDSYDDSVHSAMHIYEQAKNKSIDHKAEEKRMIPDSNCNSLPLRRMKKELDLVLCRSEANLAKIASNEEENLVKEVRQKLNELGLYKYQRSKAARELAEIRQALCNLQNPSSFAGLGKTENVFERSIEYPKLSINMQNFPLPPIPVIKHKFCFA